MVTACTLAFGSSDMVGFKKLPLLIALAAGAMLTGCQAEVHTVPVEGQVLIDGKPLTTGFVRFVSASGNTATGQLDSAGKFQLTTFHEKDGVVPGQQSVEVIAIEAQGSTTKHLIPKKYATAETSGITLPIEKATRDVKIELTWQGETPEQPEETSGDVPPPP
jgi:hypothetical protein